MILYLYIEILCKSEMKQVIDDFFFVLQEVKKAILADLTKLGKSSGLHSFEQVSLYSKVYVIALLL